jgi:hypothetical protein
LYNFFLVLKEEKDGKAKLPVVEKLIVAAGRGIFHETGWRRQYGILHVFLSGVVLFVLHLF